ncbi:unnamed protein product [Meloidogyne enterolobii]|uniref:Uncharacterized protein n=1 Tax=Meloidogyne enterolobii TaxID=390850 RepID=A0ACB0YZK6_MELEN
MQSSLHPRANTKIVDKVDNKGCFVWSFNLQKNKEKVREGKEDKQKRDQTYTGKRANKGPGFEQWLNEKTYNGKRVNEVRDFNQWFNEKYNQPPTVDINCSLWNMRKNKKKNEKKKLRHANPRQTSGGARNRRNVQRKVSKTKKHQPLNFH